MAEVKITPKISCDNCGFVADKINYAERGGFAKSADKFDKPRDWGSCRIEGSRDADSYGNKERLDFTDLCPKCAHSLFVCAAGLFADIREEKEDEG